EIEKGIALSQKYNREPENSRFTLSLSCSRDFNIPVLDLVRAVDLGSPTSRELRLEREKESNIEFYHSLGYNLYFLLFRPCL
ncbi:hypothetical protein CEXT_537041, partial [Caerostris extrusa]